MKSSIFAAGFLLTFTGQAQTYHRQAAFVGGGGERGVCTVEITVDGAAEIGVRGDDITITNLKGGLPELRRFECTAPLPGNAPDFRFVPVSGRGKQEILRPAAEGQPAVVRIEDPQNGAGVYVFQLSWIAERPMERPMERRPRLSTDQAIDICRKEVRRQVAERFRTEAVEFREIRIDDAPGRGEWIVGSVEARREGRRDLMRFSCSVNFETGEVRSVQVEPSRER